MSAFDLELLKIQKIYPGGTLAVDSFDLQVKKGEFISFVGPSGCGKTTTLRMIAGLESITSGKLLIRGRDFSDVPAEQRPTATIFQNYAIFPHMTVYQNLAFGLEVRGLQSAEIKRKVDAIIDKLELGDVANARESAMSGGQKQRVALARGLVTEPEIILLDEPLGALDSNLRKSIQEELKILQRELGITFIFVTHAQSEALGMGDRVVVMNEGRVEQISTPFELYTRPKSAFVAKFIGRNKIIPGELVSVSGDRATIKTQAGVLSGAPSFNGQAVVTGAAAMIVTPSEYIELLPQGTSKPDPNMNVVTGTVGSVDQVGQVVYVSLRIDNKLEVRLETHKEEIAGRGVEAGAKMDLRWLAERATIVLDTA